MDKPEKIDTMSGSEVAQRLGTSFMKVKSGILNHTMPIGTVLHGPGSTKDRVIIVRKRFEKWVNGEL